MIPLISQIIIESDTSGRLSEEFAWGYVLHQKAALYGLARLASISLLEVRGR